MQKKMFLHIFAFDFCCVLLDKDQVLLRDGISGYNGIGSDEIVPQDHEISFFLTHFVREILQSGIFNRRSPCTIPFIGTVDVIIPFILREFDKGSGMVIVSYRNKILATAI